MEDINMKQLFQYKHIHLYWWVFLVFVSFIGIAQMEKTKPEVYVIKHITVPVYKPLQPLNASEICSAIPRCVKLAEVLVYEARGEGTKGQIAVAHVILNRMKDSRWPNKIVDVIKQPHQFSYLKDKHKQSKPTADDWNTAMKIAYNTIFGYIDSPIGDATHYHATRVKPKWARKLEPVAKIGQHIFYR